MSKIKASNTKPEVLIKKILTDLQIPYKENLATLPGKPDIYIPHLNLVVMINGCFWHGHLDCRFFVLPRTNSIFWKNKIYETKNRDSRNVKELKSRNFNVCTIWECEIKNGDFFENFISMFI